MPYANSITLRQLEVLNGIIAGGSIRQGANILGVSQPTVSHQLAKLEEVLGMELINRDRQRSELLTRAGGHWARIARKVLHDIELGFEQHAQLFDGNNYKIAFATIPSHRGRIVGIASRIAREEPVISEFSLRWAPSSETVRELLEVRKANVALLALTEPDGNMPGYTTRVLYEDRIIWAVPTSVSDDLAQSVLAGEAEASGRAMPQALLNRVVVEVPHLWRQKSEEWFAAKLPTATPFFGSDLHHNAAEIVAEGLATCHVSTTLFENLPPRVLDCVRFYDTGIVAQRMGLAMPQQMATNKKLLAFFEKLASGIQHHYRAKLDNARPSNGRDIPVLGAYPGK